MKQALPVVLVSVVLLVVIGLSSCLKKEYTCLCRMNTGEEIGYPLGRMSNDIAQKQCNKQQIEMTYPSTGTVSACKVIY